MSEKKRLLKNTFYIAMGSFGAKAISFILLPLYTAILTTAEYGTYDYIISVGAFLLPVVSLSIHEAMFRFIIEKGSDEIEFKRTVSNAFFSICIGLAILTIAMLGLGWIFVIEYCYYILAYVVMTCLYNFSNYLLRGLGEMKFYAVNSSIKNISQLALNVLSVAFFRWGVEGLLFSMCISEMSAFGFVFIKKKLWTKIDISYISKKVIVEQLRYSLPLIPNSICAQIIYLSDRVIVSMFLGVSANGIYAISYKFPSLVETIYHYFYNAWSESASRVISKGEMEAKKYYQSLYQTVDNVMFSLIILMVAGMPILFRVFIQGDYVEGFVFVPLLMISMYFHSLAQFYSGIFAALKRTKIIAKTTLVSAIVNVGVNLLLIQLLGLYAAAISSLLANMVLVIIRSVNLRDYIDVKIDIKQVTGKIIVVVTLYFLYSYDNIIKIIISIMASVAYAAIVNRNIIETVLNKRGKCN